MRSATFADPGLDSSVKPCARCGAVRREPAARRHLRRVRPPAASLRLQLVDTGEHDRADRVPMRRLQPAPLTTHTTPPHQPARIAPWRSCAALLDQRPVGPVDLDAAAVVLVRHVLLPVLALLVGARGKRAQTASHDGSRGQSL